MKKFLTFFMIAILGFGLFANPSDLFNQANQLYQNEQFNDAIQLYDSIVDMGYNHQETYYNLANCHFRTGNLGLAILNYEKALKLNPKDEDALHNLAIAQKQVVDEFNVVPIPALERIFRDASSIFNSGTWSLIGLGSFFIMIFLVAIFLYLNRNGFFLTLAAVFLVFGIMLEGFAYGKYRLEEQDYAILVEPNSYVKSAPAETSQDLFILHEGTKVRVLDGFSGWRKIKLPDGKIGWILEDDISII